MDRDPLEQFEYEAQALDDGEKLATVAEMMAGESAGALLIGAALKVMERQFGYEHAIAQARIALEVIVNAKPAGAEFN